MSNVKGLEKLLKTIKKIPKELAGDVSDVLEANAQEIERNAKENAPVDTGKLQQSIKALKTDSKTYKILANATGLAPYAPYVEHGTYKQSPQPFLIPAFYKGIDAFLKDLKDLLDDTFSKL